MNIDLGKTQINKLVRVSSAAVFNEAHFGKYWQVETWIFSNDPRQRSAIVIHGTCGVFGDEPPRESLCAETRKVHGYIAANLRRKLA